MKSTVRPTTREVFFPENEIIVSKTDVTGRITYANETFCKVSGYCESDLVGRPHNLIRHPDMPRSVFMLLWRALLDRREMFAFVKNMTRTGDFYWALAHVTPSRNVSGDIVGYHSNRRVPDRDVVRSVIAPLYASVLQAEQAHRSGKDAVAAGADRIADFLRSKDQCYDAFIFSL